MIENRTYYVDNDKNKKINVIYDIDEYELDIITKRATKGEKYSKHKLLCKLLYKISYNGILLLMSDFFIGMLVFFLFLFTFDVNNSAIAFATLFGFMIVILGVVFAIFFVTMYYSDRIIDYIEAVPILEDINALLSHVDEYKVATTYDKKAYYLIFNDNRLLYFKTSNLTLHLNSDLQSNYYWEYSIE